MTQRLPRRRFFSLVAVTASSVCAPLGCGSDDGAHEEGSSKFFPQSVASGDPRETSIVLWTRVVDPARPDDDLPVELELSKDKSFGSVIRLNGAATTLLTATAASDHCVRVRVDSLDAGTVYYYRFRYEASGSVVTSRVGRTRTAPPADADVPVKFGVVCCQSYGGRYFHVLRQLATYELDFVLHLGDYIYETGRAAADGPRAVVFGKPGEALEIGNGELAARSLDNYRDLYKLYRSDPDLQAVHERFPMLVIPDDHEFSDDSHGATASYFDERVDETDIERRMASDRAWFEYMPVDYAEGTASEWQATEAFPADLRVYRSFGFGRHLELVLTDERRYRPDHLVPESALPGAIFGLSAELPDVPLEELVPCVSVDAAPFDVYGAELTAHADELGLDASQIHGHLSAPWLNAQLAAAGSTLAPIDLTEATLERGYAYHQILKSAQYTRLGSRYVLAERPFYELARLAQQRQPDAQNVFGPEQRSWFLDTLKKSTRTFKVWGSEVAFLSRKLDLTGVSALPPEMQTRIVISGDDWDGFPDEQKALFDELVALDNVVILSGDLHCFFAGTPFDPAAPERRIVEILTGSVSSTAWIDAITEALKADPSVPPSVANVASAVGPLLQDPTKKPNPHLAFQELSSHGCSVIRVDGDELAAELLLMTSEDVKSPMLSGALVKHFRSEQLRVRAGTRTLERAFTDGFYSWDVTSAKWVPS